MLTGDTKFYRLAYDALGDGGVESVLEHVDNERAFKLVTGVDIYEPLRPSKAGRAFGDDFWTIYLANEPLTTSGEVIPNQAVPEDSLLAEYVTSGMCIDFDRIGGKDFQTRWRNSEENEKYAFSQGFSTWLKENNLWPQEAIGGSWSSVGCEKVDREGRCYGIIASGEAFLQFRRTYGKDEWPPKDEVEDSE